MNGSSVVLMDNHCAVASWFKSLSVALKDF